ncbi:PREDICTED: G-protein coupled receptor Mth2 isoform X2 [Rhagoletis zephyria]|uniref:G-protein coupled receptor Mth2 isoform X2 n=1 Tax=Rhagoletis zephyria TaxID=28612 RepID=UPI000811434D|nr:PREDICTED: G-protein coupled receptor Mth2 isoform X2 [Rhagoletis zephyria]
MSLLALILLCVAGSHITGVLGVLEDSAAAARRLVSAPICCPLGWSLLKLNMGFFRPELYECRNVFHNGDEKKVNDKETENSIEVFERTAPVYGYHIQSPELDQDGNFTGQVPQCARQTFLFLTSDKEVELPPSACLTSVDQRLAAIFCPPARGEVLQSLSVVHKCCPLRYVYDTASQMCIQSVVEQSFQRYGSLLQQWAIFVDGAVQCEHDMVLVEYQLSGKELKFIDGKLAIAIGNEWKKFQLSEYCMETIETLPFDVYDVGEQRFLVRTCQQRRVCQGMACIRRCCEDGEFFTKGNATSYCKRDESDVGFHSFESLQISGNFTKPPVFGILRGLDCKKFLLNPDLYSADAHTINSNDGSLFVANGMQNYSNSQYCVEKIRNSSFGEQKLYTFLCFDSKVVGNDKIRFKMYPIGLLISCSFYALTLGVYLSISRLPYLGIALGQLIPTNNDNVCFLSGYFIYFCLMAAFAWMNVMCFDIWQTFGTAKNKRGFQKNKETGRFLLYALYGYGLPTLMTVITVSLAKSHFLSENLRPNFKQGRCWFTYGTLASANLLFFSGPIGVLSLINFVLFLLTLRYCNRVKREIFRMQSSNAEKPMLRRRFFVDKARFAMNTKLFIVMGITWFLELLSIVLYDRKKMFFWVISDSFNVLLGVFVFFIFVFKKRIWHTILAKLGFRSSESLKTLPPVTCATQSTYAPHSLSMTRLNAIEGNLSLLCNAAKN